MLVEVFIFFENGDIIVSLPLPYQFDSQFTTLAKSGVVMTGLELQDFIDDVDKLLRVLYDTNTKCFVDRHRIRQLQFKCDTHVLTTKCTCNFAAHMYVISCVVSSEP